MAIMHPSNSPVPERSMFRIFWAFLAPMLLSNFLQSSSMTLNVVFMGNLLNKEAVAAVTGFFPLLLTLIALVIGLGAGSAILLGQAWGAKEHQKIHAIASSFLTLVFVIGILIAFLGEFYLPDLLAAIGTPANIVQQQTTYARIMMYGMPFIFVFIAFTSMLRGVGDTLTPLYALIISNIISFVLTPVLILGWLGLPRLGVESAALAGMVSNLGTLAWLWWYLKKKNHPLHMHYRLFNPLRMNWRMIALGSKLALPTSVQMTIVSLAELILLRIINQYGSDATAATGAVNQIIGYVQFPALSIAITVSILSAQAIGRGNLDSLRDITRTGIYMNLFLTGGLVVCSYLFSGFIISWFIKDAYVVQLAQTLLHITLWSLILFGIARVFSATMQATGDVFIPMGINIVCLLAIELPVAFFMSTYFGLEAIWWAYPIVFASMLMLQFAYYWCIWRKKPIQRLV